MTSVYLGSSKTNKNGTSTFEYHGTNRGIVDIVAVVDGDISKPCKILDYDIQVISDISIDKDGVLLIESISSDEINDINFINDISIDDNGELVLVDTDINIYDTTPSEINDKDGVLIIKTINDILDWL